MQKNPLDFYKKNPVKADVSVIGIPFEEGSDATGLRNAPTYLRKCGLVKQLKRAGINAFDLGDALFKQSKSKDKMVIKHVSVAMAEAVAKKVEDEVRAGKRVLALGGDHSISLGTIAGASVALDKNLAVIWIDAHPDICTWEESITKNTHGMQVAALLGVGDNELVNVYKNGAKIKKQDILYIGLKDMDEYEINYLRKENIKVVTMFDIDKKGMTYVFEVVEQFLKNRKNIWVSLDMDGIQKQYVPSSPMATDEGLTAREALSLVRFIGRTGNIIGADIVELSAKGDVGKKTANLAIDLAAKLFGSDAGWYERYMSHSL